MSLSLASDIEANLRRLEERIARACARAGGSPQGITLVAVTKSVAPWAIEAAFQAGVRHFGENRVQEARAKVEALSHLGLTWHMVGHLQTNKVKMALKLFAMIQSVDSVRLAQKLSQHAEGPVPVLLQVNVAGEVTKSGFRPEEVARAAEEIARLPKLKVEGLMTIAPWVSDPETVRPVFRRLRELRDALGLEHLSMGMTDDFEVAVEEGATILRIGRALFGERLPHG
ncbi:MAG TPA: YggS family pyridoxal phosphate-dependent enzyme [Dehalococcoidia bacterium]|nr:YggS family pyridoxal phosphate-dependent enzyme [Dehalococcoidia bacterium]